jgi:hypothetical protein
LAQIASAGGVARAEKLSPEERQAISRRGAQKRWGHKKCLTPPRMASAVEKSAVGQGCT